MFRCFFKNVFRQTKIVRNVSTTNKHEKVCEVDIKNTNSVSENVRTRVRKSGEDKMLQSNYHRIGQRSSYEKPKEIPELFTMTCF